MTSGGSVPPPRRRYPLNVPRSEPTSRHLPDTVTHVLPLGLGFGIGVMWLVFTHGVLPIYLPLATAAGLWLGVQIATRLAGGIAERYTTRVGATTPHQPDYSRAQALASQGHYRDAIGAYEIAAAEAGGDPQPYLAIARICRDALGDPEEAAAWFRRARRDGHLDRGQELLIAQELVELYRAKLGDPRRAIPELARIVQLAPGTPSATAAADELAALRERVRAEDGRDGG